MEIARSVLAQLQPFRAVVASPDLRRVALAFAGFAIAEFGVWVAMLVVAFEAGGAGLAGLIGVVQLVPAALVAPFAALLADRYRRDRVLAGGYLAQAIAMGATAAALAAGAALPLVYALATVASVATISTRPAQAALLPDLSRSPAELTAATVALGAIESGSLFVGPAAAGVLLGLSGGAAVFAGMAVLVLGSAVLAVRLSPQPDPRPAARTGPTVDLRDELFGGFSTVLREPEPRLVVGLLSAHMVVIGALDVLLVVVAYRLLETGSGGVGLLNATFGIGAMAGAAGTALLVGRRRLAPALLVGALAWTVALTVTGLAPSQATAPVLIGLAGIGRTLVNVVGRMILLRGVADRVMARVFGVLEGLGLLGLAVGLLVAPAAVGVVGERGALVATGAVLPVLVLVGWRRLLAVDAAAVLREAELDLLRRVPIFAPLPPPVLERLARSLLPAQVAGGFDVIRQGDPGDRFYILAEGTVEVTVDGRPVDAHGPGGFFGEVALIRDVPRTATVTARTDVRLLALERDHFLLAVTGHAGSSAAADAVVRARFDELRAPGAAQDRIPPTT